MPAPKRFLAVLLCALLALTVTAALAAEPFSFADLAVQGVPAGASPAQAVAVLGEPLAADAPAEIPATGEVQQVYRYPGLTLTFTDGLLTDADIATDAFPSVRGLKLGDAESLLQTCFPYDAATAASAGILYAAGRVEALDQPLPPCGTVAMQETGARAYVYLAPVTPYEAAMLETPEAYVYETTAALTVLVDPATQTIVRLQWHVHPLAE